MTYTILGRDPKSGELGIAIATYSLAVGATCPYLLAGTAVATSQASTNPAVGTTLVRRIHRGESPDEALGSTLESDPHPEYRQVAMLTADGSAAIHTGSATKPYSGHISRANCIAVGNFLQSKEVLRAMADGFEDAEPDSSLAERLLAGLEAGQLAGGQTSTSGAHLPERSACLVVSAPDEAFPIDIRVDSASAPSGAIPELRAAFKAYEPMHRYYLKRAEDPTDMPSQDQWVSRLDSN